MQKGVTSNRHGTVAHSPQVPLYSTELLIEIRIAINLLMVNLKAFVNLTGNTQFKDLTLIMYFCSPGTVTYFSTTYGNPDTSITSCR